MRSLGRTDLGAGQQSYKQRWRLIKAIQAQLLLWRTDTYQLYVTIPGKQCTEQPILSSLESHPCHISSAQQHTAIGSRCQVRLLPPRSPWQAQPGQVEGGQEDAMPEKRQQKGG